MDQAACSPFKIDVQNCAKHPFLTNFAHAFLMLNISVCRGLEKKVHTFYVKSEKTHNFFRRLANVMQGSNRVFKNRKCFFLLKQKRFGKILRFIKKFCDF